MNEVTTKRAGPGGIVVWLAVVAGLCLALTVGVTAEVNAQMGGTGGFPTMDEGPACLHAPGDVLCKTASERTCGTFGYAWAILTGDVESCWEITEYWYWS